MKTQPQTTCFSVADITRFYDTICNLTSTLDVDLGLTPLGTHWEHGMGTTDSSAVQSPDNLHVLRHAIHVAMVGPTRQSTGLRVPSHQSGQPTRVCPERFILSANARAGDETFSTGKPTWCLGDLGLG